MLILIEQECRVIAEEFGIRVFQGSFSKDHIISLRHSLISGLRAELAINKREEPGS